MGCADPLLRGVEGTTISVSRVNKNTEVDESSILFRTAHAVFNAVIKEHLVEAK